MKANAQIIFLGSPTHGHLREYWGDMIFPILLLR